MWGYGRVNLEFKKNGDNSGLGMNDKVLGFNVNRIDAEPKKTGEIPNSKTKGLRFEENKKDFGSKGDRKGPSSRKTEFASNL